MINYIPLFIIKINKKCGKIFLLLLNGNWQICKNKQIFVSKQTFYSIFNTFIIFITKL